MRWISRLFSRNPLPIAVWILWFVSAATLLVSQSSELLGLGSARQEEARALIPGQDPESARSVLAACDTHVGPKETLCVAYRGTDMVELFLAFRLAYDLYPRRVASRNYSDNNLQTVIEQLANQYRPDFLLVFAEPGYEPPQGMAIAARLPLNAVLLMPAVSRNP